MRAPTVEGLSRQLDGLYRDFDRGLANPHETREDRWGNALLCSPCEVLAAGLDELEAELRRAEVRTS